MTTRKYQQVKTALLAAHATIASAHSQAYIVDVVNRMEARARSFKDILCMISEATTSCIKYSD